jgi:hypothetical protein
VSNPSNKRASDRLNERAIIFIEIMPSGNATAGQPSILICHSLDISRNGLRVCVDEALEAGSILQLGVELRELGETLYLVGEVVRCAESNGMSSGFEVAFKLLDSDGTDIQDWRELITELQ